MAANTISSNIRLVDQASGPMARIVRQGQRLSAMMQQTQALAQRGAMTVGRATAAASEYNKQLQETGKNAQAAGRHTRDMHITLTGMLKVMAYFAINLQIINAMFAPYRFLKGAISQAGEFQDKLAQINALLRMGKKETDGFSLGIRRISGQYGIALDESLDAAKEIASSISSLNIGTMKESDAVLKVMGAAARGAVIDNANLIDSTNAVRSVLASMAVDVKNVNQVVDMLFASIDVGTLSFKQIAHEIGPFMGTLSSITGHLDEPKKLKWIEETLAFFSHVSNIIPASEAATGVNRFLLAFTKQGKNQREVINALANKTGARIRTEDLISLGLDQYFNELATFIGSDSPKLKRLVGHYRDYDKMPDYQTLEAVMGASTGKLLGALFPNVRAARPIAQLVNQIFQWNRLYSDFQESRGSTEDAFNIAVNTMERQKGRLSSIFNSFKTSLALPIVEEVGKFTKSLSDRLENVVNVEAFDKLDAGGKISTFLETASDELDIWWNSGGQDKMDTFVHNIINGLVEFMDRGVGDNMPKIIDIGESIVEGLAKGMFGKITDPKTAVGSPFVQGFVGSRLLGVSPLYGIGVATAVQAMRNNALSGDFGGIGLDTMAMAGLLFFGRGGLNPRGKPPLLPKPVRTAGRMMGAGVFWGPGSFRPSGTYVDERGNVRDSRTGKFAAYKNRPENLPRGPRWDQRIPNTWGGVGRAAMGRLGGMRGSLRGRLTSPWGGGSKALGIGAPLLMAHLLMSGPMGDMGGVPGLITGAPVGGTGLGGANWGEALGGYEYGYRPPGSANALGIAATLGASGAMMGGMFGGLPGLAAGAGIGTGMGLTTSLAQIINRDGGPTGAGDWGAVAASALAGAGAGAAIGTFFGGPIGAAIGAGAGALIMGAGPAMGLLQQQQAHASWQNRLMQDEASALQALGIPGAPRGMLQQLVETGRAHGLKGRDMTKFLSVMLATGKAETGFNPQNYDILDPSKANPLARSYGPFQINSAGLGSHLTRAQLLDPRITTQIAADKWAGSIARGEHDFSDRGWGGRGAARQGWPNMAGIESYAPGSAERIHVDRISQFQREYEDLLNSQQAFQQYSGGGVTNNNNTTINVSGDFRVESTGTSTGFNSDLQEAVSRANQPNLQGAG